MKNPNQERLGRLMRQYHRKHPWRLEDGLRIPHAYPKPRVLSWWDDVGVVLNGRRVMVWWVHPRMAYSDAIDEWVSREAGEPPLPLFDSSQRRVVNWKKVGRSRKKSLGYTYFKTPDPHPEYTANHKAIEARMFLEGIDCLVRPSMLVKRESWGMGIELCMPVDVRTEAEARAMAMFTKRLVKGETTLAQEFPGYQYGQAEWVAEVSLRDRERTSYGDNLS